MLLLLRLLLLLPLLLKLLPALRLLPLPLQPLPLKHQLLHVQLPLLLFQLLLLLLLLLQGTAGVTTVASAAAVSLRQGGRASESVTVSGRGSGPPAIGCGGGVVMMDGEGVRDRSNSSRGTTTGTTTRTTISSGSGASRVRRTMRGWRGGNSEAHGRNSCRSSRCGTSGMSC